MAASKRKQDEKHLKILREMVALPHNKHCFDCHQRGPTYVNMTIGSFVCTSCSGVLRGLNPPYRVKSISMTSFTPEEMDFLRCHGNDFNRKVYLGLFDSRSQTEPDSKDEQKIKDFMAQKYEKKRWHVAPTESMREEAKRLNDTSANKKPETRPLKSFLGNNIPKFNVPNDQSKSHVPSMPHPPGPASRPSVPPSTSQHSFTINQPAAGRAPLTKQESKSSSAFDLLGDLGGADPFAAPAAKPQPQAQFQTTPPDDGFANFESAFSNDFASAAPAPTSTPFSTPVSQQSSSSFGSFTSASMPGTGSTMMSPSTASSTAPAAPTAALTAKEAGDRYAALANLDSVFGGGATGAPNVSWDGGQSGQSSWAASFPSSTSAQQQAPVNNFNSKSAFQSSTGTASNPFGAAPAAAPPSYNQVQQQQQMAASTGANPFLASSQQQQPAAGGFAQFGAQSTAQNSGFGNFATAPATTSSNFGVQNGGFPGGGWGQAPAQQQQQPQQNQAFNQAPQSQPFGQAQPPQQQFGQQPFGQGQGQGQMGAFSQPSNAQFGKQQSFGVQQQQQPFGAPQQQQQQQMGGWGQPGQNASNPFMNIPTQQGIPPNSTNPFL